MKGGGRTCTFDPATTATGRLSTLLSTSEARTYSAPVFFSFFVPKNPISEFARMIGCIPVLPVWMFSSKVVNKIQESQKAGFRFQRFFIYASPARRRLSIVHFRFERSSVCAFTSILPNYGTYDVHIRTNCEYAVRFSLKLLRKEIQILILFNIYFFREVTPFRKVILMQFRGKLYGESFAPPWDVISGLLVKSASSSVERFP